MTMYLIITIVGVLMLIVCVSFRKILYQQINAIASIVTIIGVLGTFVGIFIGLVTFNPRDIEASVPMLLGGLRFAFGTSILGILGSIILKWLALNKRKEQAALEVTNPGTTVDDLTGLLQNILDVEKEEGNKTRETLHSIENSLTGDGDNTVMAQLQNILDAEKEEGNKTRETLHSIENSLTGDGDNTVMAQLQNILDSFNEFANKMAEDKTPALIKALEEVMRDFNAKINEQFGDNFKQLNEAVGRINKWQEQYRQQMDELANQFKVAAASIEKSRESLELIAEWNDIIVSGIEKSRESLELIAERSDAIVSGAEKLDPILEALQHQTQQLNDRLEAFKALADDAHKAFPIITENLDELTNDFSTVVKETIANSYTSMQSQQEALANQSKQLEKAVKDSTDHMTHQVTVLDKALEEELTKALESLGSQLTSLSNKFVEDYTPLTAKLHEVLNMVDGLPEPSP